jgi:hypothetical protein
MDVGQLIGAELLRFPPGSAFQGYDPETRFRQHLGRGRARCPGTDDADVGSIRFALGLPVRAHRLVISSVAVLVPVEWK